MNISFNLDINQSQTISLNTIQIMSLLQMNATELQTYINEAVLENPALEAFEKPGSSAPFEYSYRPGSRSSSNDDDEEADALSIYGHCEDHVSLYDSILLQLQDLDSPYAEAAKALARCMSSDAYLTQHDIDTVGLQFGTRQTARGLELLQSLSPAGIGARNIRERLLIQLRRLEDRSPTAEKIITEYFKELAEKKYVSISKALKIHLDDVYNALEIIKTLDPFPASEYEVEQKAQYVVPDVILDTSGELHFSGSYCPELRVDSYYANMLAETDSDEVREYLSNKIRQANWVINCITQRQNIIMQCVLAIVERQKDFFESNGRAPLQPLTQKELAEKIGVNISTISRAINGKYIQCPYGSYPLSHFFCSSVSKPEEGSSVSSDLIKSRIRALVAGEQPQHPLSDQKIVDILIREGIQVSRRAIAKYRAALNIPGTSVRKAEKLLKEHNNS